MAEAQPDSVSGEAGIAGTGADDLAAKIAALPELDAAALRRRWRALVGGAIPADLGRPLTLRVLAYRLQAERLGDLDRASLRALAGFVSPGGAPAVKDHSGEAELSPIGEISGVADTPASEQRASPSPMTRPGTVLVREHAGVAHRVTVLAEGFSWNNRTFASLSQVAFAITGTRWNGPRFFGLRDKPTVILDGTPSSNSRAQTRAGARAGAFGQVVAGRAMRVARCAPPRSRSAAP